MKILTFNLFLFLFCILYSQNYTLNDCIQIALEGKKTLLSSEIGVLNATKGLKSSYSGLLPSMQLTGNRGKTVFPEQENINFDFGNFNLDDFNFGELKLDTIRTDHLNNFSAGFSINQKLYDGGRSWYEVKQAKRNLEIAKLNYRLIKTEVILNVIRSYYGLLQAQELLGISENNLELSNQQIALVKKQFDLGVVNKTDLLKAQVALGQARVDLLNKTTNLQNIRRVLFNDMGLQDFGQEIIVAESNWNIPQIPTSAEVLNLLKEKNPSILISKTQIELNNISYKIAKGLRLPLLNTSMNYSAYGETSKQLVDALSDSWNMGMNISISIPIYTGNSLSIQQQQAKLSKQQSEYSYITLLNDYRVQAELIRETLINYSEIIPLNQSVVVSAEEDLKLVRERYSLGSATILEVLDAQISLIESNSNLINTIHDARIQEGNLKALLGTLDSE